MYPKELLIKDLFLFPDRTFTPKASLMKIYR